MGGVEQHDCATVSVHLSTRLSEACQLCARVGFPYKARGPCRNSAEGAAVAVGESEGGGGDGGVFRGVQRGVEGYWEWGGGLHLPAAMVAQLS